MKFNTNNSNNTRSHSYNLKQIISHELELEKVRRTEGSQNIEKSQSEKNNENVAAETKVLKSAARQSKEITIKEKVSADFYGVINRLCLLQQKLHPSPFDNFNICHS